MAESDTILQLGIEAAREGNREEARNLFGLLTRQEPNNAQAWLWLAGVAEGPEQRRAALERVVELDPTNEMAVKGLQAIGVTPTARLDETPAPAAFEPVSTPPLPDTEPVAPARAMTDEERYAAELDSAFDDYDTVPRAETPTRRDLDLEEDTAMAGAAAADRYASSGRTARERSAARRASTPVRSGDDDDDYTAAPTRRPNNLLWLLLGLVALLLVGFIIFRMFNGNNNQTAVSPTTGAETSVAVGETGATAATGVGSTGTVTDTGGVAGTGTLTDTGGVAGTGTVTDTGTATNTGTVSDTGTVEPTPVPPANNSGPAAVANPNLQQAAIGQQLESNGWSYTFPNAGYVLPLGKTAGSFTAQGNYVHVLVWVANNTGTEQPLPANFFAMQDAQGNVFPAQAQVSSALVQRGVNADRGMEDAIPANGVLTSVYLVFDVPSGAQNVTLFAAGKNDQGWQVLSVAP